MTSEFTDTLEERTAEMDGGPSQSNQGGGFAGVWRRLNGLLVAQAFGQFNDQAWKQVVTLLAMAAVVEEAAKQEKTATRPDRADASAAVLLTAGGRSGGSSEQTNRHHCHESFRAGADARRGCRPDCSARPEAGLLLAFFSWWESRRRCSFRRSTGSCQSSCHTKSSPKGTGCSR